MKGLGAILVLLTGVYIGVTARHTLTRRVEMLSALERFLHRIAERIRCTACPIGTVFRAIDETNEFSDFPLLSDVLTALEADGEFRVAWRTAAKKACREWALSERESALLCHFAEGLGAADVMGEVRYCEQYADHFGACAEERRAEARSRGGLYTVLGFCGGSAVALLLL